MRRGFACLLIAIGTLSASATASQQAEHPRATSWSERENATRIPENAIRTLEYIREYDAPPPGFEGGRVFGNYAGTLPRYDESGHTIRYQEWDVKPHLPRRNRGAERIVTGSDGRAWYTRDHYRTFVEMR